MITVVDTNILLDIFLPDKKYAEESGRLLKSVFFLATEVFIDLISPD